MATVEALNEAILAAPDEELPRLAYSDAVATRDVARGEFIKLQIVLARWRKAHENPSDRPHTSAGRVAIPCYAAAVTSKSVSSGVRAKTTKRVALLVVPLLLALAGCPARLRSECRRTVAGLEREVAKLPSHCTRDSECVCYVGGVAGVTDCGGVSDVATADRIASLNRELRADRCEPSVACAARLCTAHCAAGVCAP